MMIGMVQMIPGVKTSWVRLQSLLRSTVSEMALMKTMRTMLGTFYTSPSRETLQFLERTAPIGGAENSDDFQHSLKTLGDSLVASLS